MIINLPNIFTTLVKQKLKQFLSRYYFILFVNMLLENYIYNKGFYNVYLNLHLNEKILLFHHISSPFYFMELIVLTNERSINIPCKDNLYRGCWIDSHILSV